MKTLRLAFLLAVSMLLSNFSSFAYVVATPSTDAATTTEVVTSKSASSKELKKLQKKEVRAQKRAEKRAKFLTWIQKKMASILGVTYALDGPYLAVGYAALLVALAWTGPRYEIDSYRGFGLAIGFLIVARLATWPGLWTEFYAAPDLRDWRVTLLLFVPAAATFGAARFFARQNIRPG